jgi:hypothetical protein
LTRRAAGMGQVGMRGGLVAGSSRLVPVRMPAAGLAAVVVAALAAVLAGSDGFPVTRSELVGGGAWLASPGQGVVTLLDGAAEQVVGAVRVPGPAGAGFSVVQAGSSAYVLGGADGTVSRVDGATYAVSAPVRFGAGGSVQVSAGRSSTYVIDGARQSASVVDPTTLRVRETLALASRPGPGQSVVDNEDRLWVVDRGGVAWFDATGKHVRPDAGGPDSRLLLVHGRPVVVDLARARVASLADTGRPLAWSCLDVPADREPQLLGSTALGRVVAAAPATGGLVIAGTGRDDCGRSLTVGRPGDEFGPLVEAAGYLLVPNRSSGRAAIVDTTTRRLVAELPVVRTGHRLELVTKDGLVFYNDLDGDRAGVLRFDGRQWTVGASQLKYRRDGRGVLITAGAPGLGPVNGGRGGTDPPRPDRPDPARPDAQDPADGQQPPPPATGEPSVTAPPGAPPQSTAPPVTAPPVTAPPGPPPPQTTPSVTQAPGPPPVTSPPVTSPPGTQPPVTQPPVTPPPGPPHTPDRTPPDPTLTGLGHSVGIGTGPQSVTLPRGSVATVSAAATDADSAVTRVELWAEVDGFCLSIPERPVHRDAALRVSSAGPSTTYELSEAVAREACGGALFASMVFRLRARAVSEGGTSAFTDALTVTFPGSAD